MNVSLLTHRLCELNPSTLAAMKLPNIARSSSASDRTARAFATETRAGQHFETSLPKFVVRRVE
jgi:hypothetical protein